MKFPFFAYFLASLLMVSCASSRVHTDWDINAHIERFNSFRFTDMEDQSGSNPLYQSSQVESAIHAQISTELEKRGIHQDLARPELLISYHTYTEQKQGIVNNYYPMMYGGYSWRYYPWNYNPYPYGYWNGYSSRYVFTEGTLIIDVISAKTKLLVWRGSISDAISDPNDLHKKAIRAVHLIFDKFPIRPGHKFTPPTRQVAENY